MKKVTLLALLLVSSICTSALAEENAYAVRDTNDFSIEEKKEEISKNYQGLGFHASLASGTGFSYRTFFADKWGAKVSGLGFFTETNGFASLGTQAMYVVQENDWFRFYGLGGGAIFFNRGSSYDYDTKKSSIKDDLTQNVGAGVGIELGRREQYMSFVIELPMVLGFKQGKVSYLLPVPQVSWIINF
jgi:hypothetical protein